MSTLQQCADFYDMMRCGHWKKGVNLLPVALLTKAGHFSLVTSHRELAVFAEVSKLHLHIYHW